MRVVFAGGGTGGHLFPGLALAEELRRREPESRLLFLCTERDDAYPGLDAPGIEVAVLPSRNRGPLPLRLAAMGPALIRAFRMLRRFRPDVAVGLGGYGSVAPVLCARLLRVPCILLEQNVVPGRSNRHLARLANAVASQWEEAAAHFPCPRKVHFTGNPIRSRIRRRDRAEAAAELGLDPAAPTLLVMGGSQGATPLNDLVIGALPHLIAECACSCGAGDRLAMANGTQSEIGNRKSQMPARLQVVHLAGRSDAERVRAAYEEFAVRGAVFEFLENVSVAYSVCDLALCRAGGTSIAELTALGIPAILVPYPHAKDNHQHLNAQVLEDHGAAVLLEQKTLSSQPLAECIAELLADPGRLAHMASQSKSIGAPAAAGVVADHVAALARA